MKERKATEKTIMNKKIKIPIATSIAKLNLCQRALNGI